MFEHECANGLRGGPHECSVCNVVFVQFTLDKVRDTKVFSKKSKKDEKKC